jgi:hypothetical protein
MEEDRTSLSVYIDPQTTCSVWGPDICFHGRGKYIRPPLNAGYIQRTSFVLL